MGMADQALELWRNNVPGYFHDEGDLRQISPPYMYANCYYGPDHRNKAFQMEFTWITGSLAWLNNLFLKELLGAKPDYGGLRIDPCTPSEWKECSVERYFRGATYKFRITNPDQVQKGRAEITFDGEQIEGDLVPILGDDKIHQVNVVIKPGR